VLRFEYPIAAVPGNTVKEPRGPWALPGRYTVRLTVGNTSAIQPLLVKMDPRVKTPPAGIARQHQLTLKVTASLQRNHEALTAIRARRAQLRAQNKGAAGPGDQDLAALEGAAPAPGPGSRPPPGLTGLNAQLASLYKTIQQADVAPTARLEAAAAALDKQQEALLATWRTLQAAPAPR
jgi:hypothetical protein